MSKFGPWTPGTIPDDYEARVAADVRNILGKTILRARSMGFNSQNPNSTQPGTQGKENSTDPSTQGKENNPSPSEDISEEEFKRIFPDNDDVDDSEEIFQQIIKMAEEAAKRDIEMNKKNPLLAILNLNMIPEKKTRKRKNKGFEKTLDVMNKFKKSLVEPLEVAKPLQEKTASTLSTINSSKIIKPIIKNSCLEGDTTCVKVYPKWKTTATYTPIFSSTTNPNWANINSLAESDKMYTPGHISCWINSAKTDSHVSEAAPSSKSFRSNITTIASSSILKNSKKTIINKETPIESNTVISTNPKRSTVVRFSSLSPEKIPWDSDGNSSISSKSFIEEEMNFEQSQDSDNENSDYYLSPKQNENNYCFTPMQNQTFEWYQKLSEKYTFSDEQHISKYNYETSLKNIETPNLINSLHSSTPIENMNDGFKPSPLQNGPWNVDDQSSISSTSLIGDNIYCKQLVDSNDENSHYQSKKNEQYPQRKQLLKVHQECTEKFNFTGKKNVNTSPLGICPRNCDNESLISPISLTGDKITFNQFVDSDDEHHQYHSKQTQQQKKLVKVHQEYKEKFNFSVKLNPNNRLKQNVGDAPFVMQKFVNTLAKKLNHNNYDMEVKCSMKLKKKLF